MYKNLTSSALDTNWNKLSAPGSCSSCTSSLTNVTLGGYCCNNTECTTGFCQCNLSPYVGNAYWGGGQCSLAPAGYNQTNPLYCASGSFLNGVCSGFAQGARCFSSAQCAESDVCSTTSSGDQVLLGINTYCLGVVGGYCYYGLNKSSPKCTSVCTSNANSTSPLAGICQSYAGGSCIIEGIGPSDLSCVSGTTCQ